MNKKIENAITILNFDTLVKFGDPVQTEYFGHIVAARVSKHTIMYEIKYFKDNSLNTILLLEEDFTVLDKKKKVQKVGFVDLQKEISDEEKA